MRFSAKARAALRAWAVEELRALPACSDAETVADYALGVVSDDIAPAELRGAADEELSMFLGAGEARSAAG